MLVPVDTIPVADLIRQLSVRPYKEWITYNGVNIKTLPFDKMVRVDPIFQLFWACRLLEEKRAFLRILEDPGALDRFDKATISRWAKNKLRRVRRRISRMNLSEYKDTSNPQLNREDL